MQDSYHQTVAGPRNRSDDQHRAEDMVLSFFRGFVDPRTGTGKISQHKDPNMVYGIWHMRGCPNYGPCLCPPITRCRIILRTKTGIIVLTSTQVVYQDEITVLAVWWDFERPVLVAYEQPLPRNSCRGHYMILYHIALYCFISYQIISYDILYYTNILL